MEIATSKFGPSAPLYEHDGEAYYLSVIPMKSQPYLIVHNGSEAVSNSDQPSGCDGIDTVTKLRYTAYGWDTPEYRKLCTQYGLHPDLGRPTYRHADKGIIDRLESCLWKSHSPVDNVYILDMIDCLRTDIAPDLDIYERILDFVESNDLGPLAGLFDEAISRVDLHSMKVRTYIEFLPSWMGGGYTASIYHPGKSVTDDDERSSSAYAHLAGVALEPANGLIKQTSVYSDLKQRGVIFLSREEAQDYLNSEGSYWSHRCKHKRTLPSSTGLYHRAPSRVEKLKWALGRPPTPMYDSVANRPTNKERPH